MYGVIVAIPFRLYQVRCARCGDLHENSTRTRREFVWWLKLLGWRERLGKWYCPMCAGLSD